MWESIPQELKFDGLWCCWKKTEKGKVPFDVKNNTFAKSNNKDTFYPFMTILKHVQDYYKVDNSTGALLGGIGLGIFNGFSAIDIDHCFDKKTGKLSDMAKDVIDYCQSYTEYSPSGEGIRIIVKTDTRFSKSEYYTNNAKIGLEVYIEGLTNKFVTITGNTIYDCEIAKVDLQYILDKYMKKKSSQNQQSVDPDNYKKTNKEVEDFLDKDFKLRELWNGHAPGSGANENQLDLALCTKLAFYCQKDFNKIAEAFERSPYYASKDKMHKNKWSVREDYRVNTINAAIDGCSAVYNPEFFKTKTKKFDLNDTGNAHRFIDKFGENIKYNYDNRCWMTWNGNYWQNDYLGNIKNLAEILIEEMKMEAFKIEDEDYKKAVQKNISRLCSSAGKEAMLKEAQHLVPTSNSDFDQDDFLFNCKSGVINLKTGEIYPPDKYLMLSKYSDCEFEDEVPEKFCDFLNEIFEDNVDIIDYLQKAFGYSLTGSTREQVMFLFTGDGSNGKSLLLQIINEIMGDYAATSSVELLLEKKVQSANLSEVARLRGIRSVTTGESKLGDKLNEGSVKSLTGGNDKITARFLYANEFEFYPKMKIFMATNHTPIIRGTDYGIWRRIVKIPFKRVFSEKEQDKDLINKLRKEKSRILNWLVFGAQRWCKEGLKMPSCLVQEVKEYKTEMDLVAKWVEECCEEVNYEVTRGSELFKNFIDYCKVNNEYVMSQTLFGRNFSKKYKKVKKNGVIYYAVIRLKI